MAEQDLIKLARGAIEAFNATDWQGFKALLAPDSIYNELGTQRRIQGADQIIQLWQGWKQAMPDVKGTVTNAFASGDTVALEITWEGTHTGPLEGPGGTIPASGRRQVTPSAFIFTFQADKIKESRNYFDIMTLLQQIGAMPPPGQAGG
jgi:steroid delta-isomerase-like uncharacterized protein